MKYDVQEHLKPRGLTGISDEQIEQHWHLYEAYVKNTNELLGEIETAEHGSRAWGELKRRLGFEFNGMGRHTGVARGLRPDGRDARRRLGDPLPRPTGGASQGRRTGVRSSNRDQETSLSTLV